MIETNVNVTSVNAASFVKKEQTGSLVFFFLRWRRVLTDWYSKSNFSLPSQNFDILFGLSDQNKLRIQRITRAVGEVARNPEKKFHYL